MNVNLSTGSNVKPKQMKPWHGVLFGLIFFVVGIALLYFSFLTIKTYSEKNKTFVEITSKVVDYVSDDEGLQAIVVEYEVDGQTYQKVSNVYSSMPKSIGTEVSIKYNPSNPQDAIWASDSTNIFLPLIAVMFTLAGIFIMVSSIKNGKKQKILDTQVFEQSNGLYSNVDVYPQTIQSSNNVIQSSSNNDINNQNN
ncbi:MAG: DUF3592 domain-containing protein [Candidatus Coprovivens sp.]